jgi:hypothetical protein
MEFTARMIATLFRTISKSMVIVMNRETRPDLAPTPAGGEELRDLATTLSLVLLFLAPWRKA